jgi:leucyl/phenylalanyl-tRNA--protein transferase
MRRRVPFLPAEAGPAALPDPEEALTMPNGLVAAGGALTPPWLLGAYQRGIFPWYSPGEPILWWSPDPRTVFDPATFKPSRSLRQSVRNRGYETRVNADFRAVMLACAEPRADGHGTWISEAMIDAYCHLHELGYAHSVETWLDGECVGGLYGVRLNGVFFGESMYSRARDASKVALVRLVEDCRQQGIGLIDCQMPTEHLASLGALTVPRKAFLLRLKACLARPD